MARKHLIDAKSRRSSYSRIPSASSSISASSINEVGTSNPRGTPCSRRSISPQQRALFFKAFLVWILFSLGGWLTIPPEFLPLLSHCMGFGFFLVLTTHKARWLGALLFGTGCFCILMYYTLPEHLIHIVSNSFGWTAFAVTCVVVTGCTVVQKGLAITDGATNHSSVFPRSSSRGRGGFAMFRDRMLESSCGDSSMSRVYSGRYLEEHLEQRGIVTLDETTGRVAALRLPGSSAPIDVAGAVSTASTYFDEVSAILIRVASDQEFISFLHTIVDAEKLQQLTAAATSERTEPRQIHILATNEPGSAGEDEASGEEGLRNRSPSPIEGRQQSSDEGSNNESGDMPISTSSLPSSSSSSFLSSSASLTAEDAVSFLARASRTHLYAVIRHLNSQLLTVESALRMATVASDTAAKERSTFERTIRTLKGNLDRECATRMQITNELFRRKEEEILLRKRAAKEAAHQSNNAGGVSVIHPADVHDNSSSANALKQSQLHLKELSKKIKSLTTEAWNTSHALSSAIQRNKLLEETIEHANRNATKKEMEAKQFQKSLTAAQEEQRRMELKLNQQWEAKFRTLEAQKRALDKELGSLKSKQSMPTAHATPATISDGAVGSAAAPDPATIALLERMQAQLADSALQAQEAAKEAARTSQQFTAQLDAQSNTISTLSAEKQSMQQDIDALRSALHDAHNQLSVEQTIVSSLSNAAGDTASAWNSPSNDSGATDALAAVFDHSNSNPADLGDVSASSSSSHLSTLSDDDIDDLTGSSASMNESLLHEWDHIDETLLDPAVMAELDRQQMMAQSMVDQFSPTQTNMNVNASPTEHSRQLQHTPITSASISSASSWSLYSSPTHARLHRSGSTGISSNHALAPLPPSTLWSSLVGAAGPTVRPAGTIFTAHPPSVHNTPLQQSLHPPYSVDEQRQLTSQLDALEIRIKQLKQQQQQQQQQQVGKKEWGNFA
jgi:hypothetical protein